MRRVHACLVSGITAAALDLSGCSSLPTSAGKQLAKPGRLPDARDQPFLCSIGRIDARYHRNAAVGAGSGDGRD